MRVKDVSVGDVLAVRERNRIGRVKVLRGPISTSRYSERLDGFEVEVIEAFGPRPYLVAGYAGSGAVKIKARHLSPWDAKADALSAEAQELARRVKRVREIAAELGIEARFRYSDAVEVGYNDFIALTAPEIAQ